MNLQHSFRRLMYVQVLLAVVAFALAVKAPGLLLVAGGLCALAWYIVETPKGRPLPQLIIVPGAMGSFLWLMFELFYLRNSDVILAMGRFTIWLQLVMLFGHKRVREYSLILVLSLMLMIAASVQSNSMVFGTLLVIYCLLGMVTILMFHLKVVDDQMGAAWEAAAPSGTPPATVKVITGPGYRWQFRGTATLVGIVCAMVAAVVFVVLPRAAENSRQDFAGLRFNKSVGFSTTIRLTGAPLAGGSSEPVLHVTIRENGVPIRGEGRSWLLRGAALNSYDRRNQTWRRDDQMLINADAVSTLRDGAPWRLVDVSYDVPVWEVTITQRLAGVNTLFTIHPVSQIASNNISAPITFNTVDQQLTAQVLPKNMVTYTMVSPQSPPEGFFSQYMKIPQIASYGPQGPVGYTPRPPDTGGRLRGLVRAALVEAKIPLQASAEDRGSQRDLRVAAALCEYLIHHYRYELTNDNFGFLNDPLETFLFETKRGHCELFATALVQLARTHGLPARVITGFRASEFNRLGGHYTVRQSDAHAWAEIYCDDAGWVTFDPTPPAVIAAATTPVRTWYTPAMEIYEYLELAWSSFVVGFDAEKRAQIIAGIQHVIHLMLNDQTTWMGRTFTWIREFRVAMDIGWGTYSMIAVAGVCVVIVLVQVGRRLCARWGLWDRLAARFHAIRMQRQSGAVRFHNAMIELLRREGRVRPPGQSPLRFAVKLVQSDPMRFGPVVPLTELYYEVRYGERPLDESRQSRADHLLTQLEQRLTRRE